MPTPNINEILGSLTGSSTSGSNGSERPEYEVALYVNVLVLGHLRSSIRIFKDPSAQKGMSKQQAELHKTLAKVDPVKLEEALKSQESPLIQIESVKSGAGTVDTGSITSFEDSIKNLL